MVVRTEKGTDTVWDLSAKKRMTWADAKYLTPFRPVTGGRVWSRDFRIKVEGGKAVATQYIVVADLQTGNEVHRLQYPAEVDSQINTSVDAARDGKRFVSVSSDNRMVYVWDLP